MQPYLHIGGNEDGLSHPVPNDAETVERRVGITGKETYNRETLSVGDVSTMLYVHESLTAGQAFNLLVGHFKAWAANRPGGRR